MVPGGFVDFESFVGMLFPDSVAVGTFVLVEDVGSKLAAFIFPHLRLLVIADLVVVDVVVAVTNI